MARKVEVSKDVILQAALKMLIRDGYSSINIKTLSKEIGCSTQPIVWHFDNMAGLRTALSEYAWSYAKNKMKPVTDNAVGAFESIGKGFVDIAVNEPNLFHFLYLDKENNNKVNSFAAIKASEHDSELIKNISNYLGLPEENVGRYLRNTIIYAHGIATLVATNAITATEDEMMAMINRAADSFMVQEGLPADKIPQ